MNYNYQNADNFYICIIYIVGDMLKIVGPATSYSSCTSLKPKLISVRYLFIFVVNVCCAYEVNHIFMRNADWRSGDLLFTKTVET